MGTAMCPYKLFNRAELIADVEALGYRLIDAWRSPDVHCEIPFLPKYTIDAYSGFYFAKTPPGTRAV
jgi:putative methyltransferase (TIGR04325 family)